VQFRNSFIRSGASIDYGRLGAFDDAGPMADIFEKIALRKVDGRYAVLDMHHGLHPDIALTSETSAVGRWTLQFRQVDTVGRTEKLMTGEYDDKYVIEDGVWKMSQCHFTETWSITTLLSPDADIAEGSLGGPR
ncbi:nuclear transport factor 2 family protein, partial [Rhodococcus sp. NPDC056506]|uniref:nuclear transport factor 2 family protein n=1 Tax=Rhodococcus sp. NPDC056506 TaxID=3345844 RepID=UPI00366EDE24